MPKPPKPGRVMTMTPRKPTPTASQRRQPAHSPSIGPASAVMTMGLAKLIDTVSASCSVCNAAKLKIVEPNMKTARRICIQMLCGTSRSGRRQALNSTSTSTAWTAKRTQVTKGAARPEVTRCLALVSRKEKTRPEANISRIAEVGVAVSADFGEVTLAGRKMGRRSSG